MKVRPRVWAEGWWVRKEREGRFGVGGERMDVREESRAVF